VIGLFQSSDLAPHRSWKRIVVASLQPYLLHANKQSGGLMKREERHAESALSYFSDNFVSILSGFIIWKRERA
jgi:hypothetical protein